MLSNQDEAACILPIQEFALVHINLLCDAPHPNTEGIPETAANGDLVEHADLLKGRPLWCLFPVTSLVLELPAKQRLVLESPASAWIPL